MSKFFEDLWESIFIPGPTPSLLIATNVTFAALQIVLASLLVATYSIHFVILSCLSGGLWWAINWFARELKASHEQEKKDQAKAVRESAQRLQHASSESETEVETATVISKRKEKKLPVSSASKEVEVQEPARDLKQRTATVDGSQGSSKSGVSTEDEWEKVSEYESEKNK